MENFSDIHNYYQSFVCITRHMPHALYKSAAFCILPVKDDLMIYVQVV